MSVLSGLCHGSLLALLVAVGKDLLAAHMLGLKSPETLFFLSLLFEKGLLHELLISLVKDSILLLLIEALEVIGLDTMCSEHGLLGCGVLCHEIVCHGVAELSSLLLGPVLSLSHLSIALFLSEQ